MLAEMADNLMLIMFGVSKLQMSFEDFCKNHLYGSNHASPSVIGLDFFDAFTVGEPEGSAKGK